jgi:hypothetical protein
LFNYDATFFKVPHMEFDLFNGTFNVSSVLGILYRYRSDLFHILFTPLTGYAGLIYRFDVRIEGWSLVSFEYVFRYFKFARLMYPELDMLFLFLITCFSFLFRMDDGLFCRFCNLFRSSGELAPDFAEYCFFFFTVFSVKQ